jgi:hypothetical protein
LHLSARDRGTKPARAPKKPPVLKTTGAAGRHAAPPTLQDVVAVFLLIFITRLY